MSLNLSNYQVYVVRAPEEDDERVPLFASAFRRLRIEALKNDPDSYRETASDMVSLPMSYWVDLIKIKHRLIRIAFGVPREASHDISTLEKKPREIWLMHNAIPLSMVVLTGPLPRERFPCVKGSDLPQSRPDEHELRFHGGMLYVVPGARGKNRGILFEAITLDRDSWLLDHLKRAASDNKSSPPVARVRGVVRPGKKTKSLLRTHTKHGWCLVGEQPVRDNVLAESGVEGVRAGEAKGYDMDESYPVLEKVFTIPQLEGLVAQNREVIAAFDRKTRGQSVKL